MELRPVALSNQLFQFAQEFLLPHKTKLHGVGDNKPGLHLIPSQEQGTAVKPDGLLIPSLSVGPLHEASLYEVCNRICKENNLRRIRIHEDCHSAAVSALSHRVNPIGTFYGLGHDSFEITKRIYAQAAPMLSTEFSERIADALIPVELGGGGAINREGSNV